MKMLKWCVIETELTLTELTVCVTKEEAIEKAKNKLDSLSNYDKKRKSIIAGTCNVDKNGDYAIDGYGCIDADIYEVAWESE